MQVPMPSVARTPVGDLVDGELVGWLYPVTHRGLPCWEWRPRRSRQQVTRLVADIVTPTPAVAEGEGPLTFPPPPSQNSS